MPPTALLIVKQTITEDREEAFNRWYNEEHVPQFMQWKGVVSARRYKAFLGEDKYQYIAIYELESQESLERLFHSDLGKALRDEYDKNFGDVSERVRFMYTQVWP